MLQTTIGTKKITIFNNFDILIADAGERVYLTEDDMSQIVSEWAECKKRWIV
jgi:hypothetical protein